MDDTIRAVGLGLAALFAIHGSMAQRARHGAERQTRESFHITSFNDTAHVHVQLQPRGFLGLEASDFWSVDVYGEDVKTDRLPFYVYPKGGWKGSIRHLRLHFKRFTLAGLPIRSFEADLPFATFDIGHALYKSRLVLRGAGRGPATVSVDAEGLKTFIARKFSSSLDDVTVRFVNRRIIIEGKVNLFSSVSSLSTTGVLVPSEGHYLMLTEPEIRINGVLITSQSAAVLLKQFNPVLDAEKDLGLGGYFEMESVEVKADEIVITGHAAIPISK